MSHGAIALYVVGFAVLAGLSVLEREWARRQRDKRRRAYRAYLKSEEWQERRRLALERAKGRCQDCARQLASMFIT